MKTITHTPDRAEVSRLEKLVKEATAHAESAMEQAQELSETQHTLEVALAFAKHGIAPGVLVEGLQRHRRLGEVFRITGVSTDYGRERPWAKGQRRRKDGTFEERSRDLYEDWQLVET